MFGDAIQAIKSITIWVDEDGEPHLASCGLDSQKVVATLLKCLRDILERQISQ